MGNFSEQNWGISLSAITVTLLRDKRVWADFARHIDAYVPEGWTRLTQLTHAGPKHARRGRARASALTAKTDRVKALDPVRGHGPVAGLPVRAAAPADHHLCTSTTSGVDARRSTAAAWP